MDTLLGQWAEIEEAISGEDLYQARVEFVRATLAELAEMKRAHRAMIAAVDDLYARVDDLVRVLLANQSALKTLSGCREASQRTPELHAVPRG